MQAKTWREFREHGLLWWVNRGLHLFGWAICLVWDDDGEITGAHPVRLNARGFSRVQEEDGYERLTRHLASEADALLAPFGESKRHADKTPPKARGEGAACD